MLTRLLLVFAAFISIAGTALAEPAPSATFAGRGGIITSQPGGAVMLTGALQGDPPIRLVGRVGIAARVPALGYTDQIYPVAGLFGVELSAPFKLTPRFRIGPTFFLDGAVLAASERHCKNGFGCRHWMWAGSDTGAGMSVAPAGGVWFSVDGSQGGRFEASIAVQPTRIYDVGIPYAMRTDLSWTTPKAIHLGLYANRYGAGIEIGRRWGGSR